MALALLLLIYEGKLHHPETIKNALFFGEL
jgi:hypothetical protein